MTRPVGASSARRLWSVAFGATLTLAMAVGTYTVFAIGALAPFITSDLGLSRASLGALVAVLYLVGGLGSGVMGGIVDAIAARRLMIVLFASAGLAWAIFGLAQNYLWLCAAVLVAGVGLALTNPATNKLMSAHVARGRQGALVGIKQSGVPLSQFLAGVSMPPLALVLGWQGAFLLSCIAAVIGIAATLAVIPAAETAAAGNEQCAGIQSRGVRWLTAYAFLMGSGVAPVGPYFALYGFERLELTVTAAGLTAGGVGLAGVAARIAWGRIGESHEDVPVMLALLGGGSAVSMLMIFVAAHVGVALLLLGGLVYGLTALAWNSVGMLAIIRAARLSKTGSASGRVQMGFYSGFIVSPVLFGYAVDATGSYDLAWLGAFAVFALATATAVAWRISHGNRNWASPRTARRALGPERMR